MGSLRMRLIPAAAVVVLTTLGCSDLERHAPDEILGPVTTSIQADVTDLEKIVAAKAKVAPHLVEQLVGARVVGESIVRNGATIGILKKAGDSTGSAGGGDAGADKASPNPFTPPAGPQLETWCMIRIWYDLDTGEILHTEILYCWDDGSGGGGGGGGSTPPPPNTPECTEDQEAIAEEYGDASNWPCDKFVDAVTSGTGTHGHATGYLDPAYTSGRDAVFAEVGLHGISPWITSDWRCPDGNAAVGGAPGSQHVQGTAGDFTASGFDEVMHTKFETAAVNAGAAWSSGYGTGYQQYTSHIHIHW